MLVRAATVVQVLHDLFYVLLHVLLVIAPLRRISGPSAQADGRRRPALLCIHQMTSQSLCRDDSTMNIAVSFTVLL